jgi:hypothetical protein
LCWVRAFCGYGVGTCKFVWFGKLLRWFGVGCFGICYFGLVAVAVNGKRHGTYKIVWPRYLSQHQTSQTIKVCSTTHTPKTKKAKLSLKTKFGKSYKPKFKKEYSPAFMLQSNIYDWGDWGEKPEKGFLF